MKKLICIALIAGFIASCHSQKTEFSDRALETKLLTTDSTEIAFKDILKQYKGKTLVIEVWASWCSDCVKAMPKVKALRAAHPEASYLFLSMDKTIYKWKSGITRHDLQTGGNYLAEDGMKGRFGRTIDLDWIPRYMVIDKTGKIVLYRAIETDFDKIDQTLNSLKK